MLDCSATEVLDATLALASWRVSRTWGELEASWRCRSRAGWLPAASWRLYGGVEAVRAGCPQRVGGFMEVLKLCGLAARSELEALWRC